MEEKESNLTKFKKNFNHHFSLKKNGLLIATFILFFTFKDRLISFINNCLLIKEDFSFYFLDLTILLSSISFTLLIIKKLIFDRYLPSYPEFYSSFFISIFCFVSLQNATEQNWTFHKDQIFSLFYIYYLLFPLVIFITLYFIKLFILYFIYPFRTERDINNEFENDDPIFRISNDKLGYSPIVKRLTNILLKEKHKKSFSIGLVGPWGNGKSSVINIVKAQIENKEILKQKKVKEPIIVHFLPYLNHNEKDIINEFFIALSDKLSKYNGKLSDEITSYSQKLTDLYKNQNISGFISNHISNIADQPAKELYDNINKRLKEIDKKIIVFVDDLDRLNDKEILEVLKLIRNTADFHNTIFLVAMDKQYVLSRLKKNNKILNSNFVEKFFQLEVYLPEIDQNILREYVFDILKKSLKNTEIGFESKLTSAFSSKFMLFDDYVKNFRDAKRLTNQVIYDYKNFGKEIDLKDFINFIFFKLKFPKFMKLLNEDRFRFFSKDLYGNYRLKEINPTKDSTVGNVTVLGNNFNNVDEYIKKYSIYDKLNIENDKCFEKTLDIDYDDKILLIKTLTHLFGDKNPISYNSIRKENNFRMLMQQRVFDNIFLEEEFSNLLTKSSKEEIVRELIILNQAKKIDQLINRIEYYSKQRKEELEVVVLIVLQLIDNKEEFKIHDSTLLNSLGRLVDIKLNDKEIKGNEELKKENINWIKNNIFETIDLSTLVKVRILSELWKARIDNELWYLEEEYISENALKLYDNYLDEKKNLWAVSDYSFYGVYHGLKIISSIRDNLKEKLKSFWIEKDIEVLCAQTMSIEAFSISAFNISDFENEIYGSKINYYNFINEHKDHNKPPIEEFLEFLYLQKITNFEKYLKFNFIKSALIKEKIAINAKTDLSKKTTDNFNKIKQVIVEINDKNIFNLIKVKGDFKNIYETSFYENEDKFHLFFYLDTAKYDYKIIKLFQSLFEVIKQEPKWDTVQFDKDKIAKKESFIHMQKNPLTIKIIHAC
jgi:predicted KAP-like P-loop ATPase